MKLKMFIPVLLSFLFFFIKCQNKCLGINAQLNSEFNEYHQNNIVGFDCVDGIECVSIFRGASLDFASGNIKKEYSGIWGSRMIYRPMDPVEKWVILSEKHIKVLNESSLISLYSMSNIEKLTVKPIGKDKNVETGIGIVSLTEKVDFNECPINDKCVEYGKINFFTIRYNDKDLSLDQSLDSEKKRKVFSYKYPFSNPQDIYYSSGALYPEKEDITSINATSIITNKNFMTQIKLYIIPQKVANINNMEFFSLMFTQRSLKLIKYEWNSYQDPQNEPTVKKAFMIMNNIVDINEELFYTSQIKISEDLTKVYVLANFDKKQATVFNNIHGFNLDFLPEETIVPFLILFDINLNNITNVIKLINQTNKPANEREKTSYLNSVDILKNKLIICGNTFFEVEVRNTTTYKHKPFYSILDLSTKKITTSYGLEKLGLESKISDFVKYDDVIFNAVSISWPVSGETDKFIIGGSIESYSQSVNKKGRAFLIDIETENIIYEIITGFTDFASNFLTDIYRIKKGDNYTMYLNLYENGPKSKDDDFVFDADIWQVDCSLPNVVLEITAKIIFFVSLFCY